MTISYFNRFWDHFPRNLFWRKSRLLPFHTKKFYNIDTVEGNSKRAGHFMVIRSNVKAKLSLGFLFTMIEP